LVLAVSIPFNPPDLIKHAMLYQEITMWKRLDDLTAIQYRCLMNQATRQFSVQSADHYRPARATHFCTRRQSRPEIPNCMSFVASFNHGRSQCASKPDGEKDY